jgi:hypothetical protein
MTVPISRGRKLQEKQGGGVRHIGCAIDPSAVFARH